MTKLVSVPQGGNELDVLAECYRAAFKKMEGGREQWINGTLELAAVVRQARDRLPHHPDFSRWLERHGLQYIGPNDRAALVGFAKIGEVKARKLLEVSTSDRWRNIWEGRPRSEANWPQCSLSETRKGALRHIPGRKRTGAQERARIPDVMRDDYELTRRPERKAVNLRVLKPEEVDPDFKGTPLEFATQYGHVPLHTKAELVINRQQETLTAWLGAVADCERAARAMIPAFAAVDSAALRDWLVKPGKAIKLREWVKAIELALACLEDVQKRG